MAGAPAAQSGATLTVDLGNSVPEQSPGGETVDLGPLQPAVLQDDNSVIPLGSPITFTKEVLQSSAGVVSFDIGDSAPAGSARIGIITGNQNGGPAVSTPTGTAYLGLAEASDGLYIATDAKTIYLVPGQQASVSLWATSFGSPAVGQQVPLSLVTSQDNQNVPADANQPAGALTFPASVTIGSGGSALLALQASNPQPLPSSRKDIGGQLYFVGGPWTAPGDVTGGATLCVKLFQSLSVPNPTWSDAEKILVKYYVLYAYMAGLVQLTNFEAVKESASAIQSVLNLPFAHPHYMPVTRELSPDERTVLDDFLGQFTNS